MKKNICILLLALLVLAGFSACGKPTATKIPDNQESTPTPVAETTDGPAEGETEAPTEADATVAPDATAAPGENATPGAAETTAPGEVSNPAQKTASTTVWKEVPPKAPSLGAAVSLPFNLKQKMIDSTLVFSGTVIGGKEYEVTWNNDQGFGLGPYRRSVIEIRINKVYFGSLPIHGNTIRMYNPYPLAMAYSPSCLIKDDGEYVFFTQVMDEAFVQRRNIAFSDDQSEPQNHADVLLFDTEYDLMPIDNGYVFMYPGFFFWNEEIMRHAQRGAEVKTDKFFPANMFEAGAYMALTREYFECAITALYDNLDKLPTTD